MIIHFRTRKLQKLCQSQKDLTRELGQGWRKVALRFQALDAAVCLKDLRNLPGRCHELAADRKGHLSLDIEHPMRLIFQPVHEPLPLKDDGGLDWARVTEVIIIEFTDTHEQGPVKNQGRPEGERKSSSSVAATVVDIRGYRRSRGR